MRILGNNIKLLLNEKGIDKSVFAEKLGYSLNDVHRLCDARLLLREEDIADIAHFFQEDLKNLYICQSEKYIGSDFMHCMGEFKCPKNEDKIHDIFDMYCDLKEILGK